MATKGSNFLYTFTIFNSLQMPNWHLAKLRMAVDHRSTTRSTIRSLAGAKMVAIMAAVCMLVLLASPAAVFAIQSTTTQYSQAVDANAVATGQYKSPDMPLDQLPLVRASAARGGGRPAARPPHRAG